LRTDNNGVIALQSVNDRRGGGVKYFGFVGGGGGIKGGATLYPNIYNIFFSGSVT